MQRENENDRSCVADSELPVDEETHDDDDVQNSDYYEMGPEQVTCRTAYNAELC
jgi:hypothetical protein